MANKNSSGGMIGIAMLIFLVKYAWHFLQDNWVPIAWVLGTTVLIVIASKILQAKKEIAEEDAWVKLLKEKYDDKTVKRILNKKFWEGQTEEQLHDSLGDPESMDEKVTKTRRTEVWKYGHIRSNQYSLRITVVNGKVSGWEHAGSA